MTGTQYLYIAVAVVLAVFIGIRAAKVRGWDLRRLCICHRYASDYYTTPMLCPKCGTRLPSTNTACRRGWFTDTYEIWQPGKPPRSESEGIDD